MTASDLDALLRVMVPCAILVGAGLVYQLLALMWAEAEREARKRKEHTDGRRLLR